jgi:hypothetical protein
MFRKIIFIILLFITLFNFEISLADPPAIELQNQRDRAEKERIEKVEQQTKD